MCGLALSENSLMQRLLKDTGNQKEKAVMFATWLITFQQLLSFLQHMTLAMLMCTSGKKTNCDSYVLVCVLTCILCPFFIITS